MTKNELRCPVRSVFKRASLTPEEPFLRMRRTFATECKRPSRRIQDLFVTRSMGHAPRSVTDAHYVADMPMDEQRQLIALLETPAEEIGRGLGAIWEPAVVPERRAGATAG